MKLVRLLKWTTILLTCVVEVRVKANGDAGHGNPVRDARSSTIHEAVAAKHWIQSPEDCSLDTKGCVWAARQGTQAEVAHTKIWVSEDVVLMGLAQGKVQLLRGKIIADSVTSLKVLTPFAEVAEGGVVLLERDARGLRVTSLQGQAQVQARGRSQPLVVPAGYSLWVGRVDETGQAQVEIPQAAPVMPVVHTWAELAGDKGTGFREQVQGFLAVAKLAVEKGSELHAELAERHVASVRESERQAAERQRLEAAEQARMRQLFRRMNFLED